MPRQDPVQVTATSAINSTVSATTYVLLLNPGPTITSVTPNPLSTGNFTVTVQGSGFQPYAEVFESYGSYSNIQLTTASLTSTTITATGYQGSATSATFTVKNPGSGSSNAITIAVSGSGGSGGGSGGGGGGNNNNNNTAPPAHVNPPAGAVTTHPRLWIRQQDLPRLRSLASGSNQVWNDLYQVANYIKVSPSFLQWAQRYLM